MNNSEYDWNDHLFEKDVEDAVKQSLQYLLDEGVIVKIGDKYRIKTKREINKELEDIINS